MSPILMMVADRSIAFTTTVVIAGVSIVVGVLLLLILVFYLFGMIVSKMENLAKNKASKKSNDKNDNKESRIKPSAPPMPAVPMPKMEVEEGISGEVVAAIAAAVAMCEGPTATVRAIKKKSVSGRNPWANAAISDNTRPF